MFSPFVSPYLRLMHKQSLFPSTAMSMLDVDSAPVDAGMSRSDDGYDPANDQSGMMGDTGTGLPNLEVPAGMRSVTVGSAGGPPRSGAADLKKQGLYAGLAALGSGLLAHSATNDWAGGLAQGIAGFSKANQNVHDEADAAAAAAAEQQMKEAANARAEHADARAEIENADRHKQAGLSYDVDQGKFEAFKKDQARGEQLRATTGKNAGQMVDDINAIASAHPEDPTLGLMAHRALGYSLGDDSDLNKLAGLHSEITARAGRSGDAAFDIKTKLDTATAEAGAGFGPKVEAGISKAHLGIAQQHEAAYEKEIGNKTANSAAYTQAYGKPAGWYDDVDKEIGRLIGPTIEERNKQAGKWDNAAMASPEYQQKMNDARAKGLPPPAPVVIQPMSPDEVTAMRKRAEAAAVEAVDHRYGLYPGRGAAGGGPTPGPGLHVEPMPLANPGHQPVVAPRPTHYHFDPRTGKLIPDDPLFRVGGTLNTGGG